MLKRLLRVLSSSRKRNQAASYILNDLQCFLGLSPFTHKTVFIAALPKSGSTWLFRIFKSIPGFNNRYYYPPTLLDEEGLYLNNWDDISLDIFKSHPSFGCSVYKHHTRYSSSNWTVLQRARVLPIILLVRDLRDVAVSLYYHHKVDESHTYYNQVSTLDFNEGLFFCINKILPDYIDWLRSWMLISKDNPDIILIKYEELWNNGVETLERVFGALELNMSGIEVKKIYEQTKLSSPRRLTHGLVGDDGFISTARLGGNRGWEACFTAEHINAFKELPNVIPIMEGFGYDI